MALRGVSQYNLDMGVFQENKVTYRIHMRASEGYPVSVSNVSIRDRGGVDVFYQDAPHFQVELLQTHGTKVLRFQVASGG